MITLTHHTSSISITLSSRLIWSDEFGWSPVAQAHRTGTDGSLHVHVGELQAGRPITLNGVDTEAWTTRFDVARLHSWAAQPGSQMTLHIRGTSRTVLFDHSRPPAFSAVPIWQLEDGQQTEQELYRLNLNFVEV